jgi:hypothetical protein
MWCPPSTAGADWHTWDRPQPSPSSRRGRTRPADGGRAAGQAAAAAAPVGRNSVPSRHMRWRCQATPEPPSLAPRNHPLLRLWCTDRARGRSCPNPARVHPMRRWFGRPSSSMRLSAWTATSTSVARRSSVREVGGTGPPGKRRPRRAGWIAHEPPGGRRPPAPLPATAGPSCAASTAVPIGARREARVAEPTATPPAFAPRRGRAA